MTLDALELITADLEREQRRRRRHFTPGAALAAALVVLPIAVFQLRSDFLSQAPPVLFAQAALWIAALGVFPAIGLGLVFPSRGAQVAVAVGTGLLAAVAAFGLPRQLLWVLDEGHPYADCAALTVLVGGALTIVALASGAFTAQRRRSATRWLAAGLGLAALNTVTWVCPDDGHAHVLWSHVTVALGVAAATLAVGSLARRRPAASPAA